MNYITKFQVRDDAHFRWDEFNVVVEFCDINIQKVALYAVEGAVEGDGGNNTGDVREATEQNPAKVQIPFNRLGYLLKCFQQNVAFLLICHNGFRLANLSYLFHLAKSFRKISVGFPLIH